MRRIPVDFNSMLTDEQRRVYIGQVGCASDDQELLASLRPGDVVVLDSGDLEVHASVEYDASSKIWFGRPDWSTRCDL